MNFRAQFLTLPIFVMLALTYWGCSKGIKPTNQPAVSSGPGTLSFTFYDSRTGERGFHEPPVYKAFSKSSDTNATIIIMDDNIYNLHLTGLLPAAGIGTGIYPLTITGLNKVHIDKPQFTVIPVWVAGEVNVTKIDDNTHISGTFSFKMAYDYSSYGFDTFIVSNGIFDKIECDPIQ